MSTQWVRQELKKNEVAAFLERVGAWVFSHREASFGIGITTLIILLLGIYSIVRYQELKSTAWERLAVAQSYAFAGQTKPSLDQLKSITEQFSRTKAAGYGELFTGDVLYQSGQYKEAIEAYQRTLGRKEPALEPFALSGISYAQEGGGEFQSAVETAQRFLVTYQDHFIAPQVHAVLARSLKAAGKEEEAKATLEKIALLYPETYWAQWANAILKPNENRPQGAPAAVQPPKAEPAGAVAPKTIPVPLPKVSVPQPPQAQSPAAPAEAPAPAPDKTGP